MTADTSPQTRHTGLLLMSIKKIIICTFSWKDPHSASTFLFCVVAIWRMSCHLSFNNYLVCCPQHDSFVLITVLILQFWFGEWPMFVSSAFSVYSNFLNLPLRFIFLARNIDHGCVDKDWIGVLIFDKKEVAIYFLKVTTTTKKKEVNYQRQGNQNCILFHYQGSMQCVNTLETCALPTCLAPTMLWVSTKQADG